MPGQGKPKYLGPNGFDAYQLDLMEGDRACNDKAGEARACTQEEKDAVTALYSSKKCNCTTNCAHILEPPREYSSLGGGTTIAASTFVALMVSAISFM